MSTSRLVVSQSIHKGKISAIFRSDSTFRTERLERFCSHDDFIKFANEQVVENRHIFSMACDEDFGIGCCTTEAMGTDQKVVWYSDAKRMQTMINKFLGADFRITACAAMSDMFYLVMTKAPNGCKNPNQSAFTASTWSDIDTNIKKKWEMGLVITSICYSTDQKQYLVIMSEEEEEQGYRCWPWSRNETHRDVLSATPTLVFKDPVNEWDLVVFRADNRSQGYRSTGRYNYTLSSLMAPISTLPSATEVTTKPPPSATECSANPTPVGQTKPPPVVTTTLLPPAASTCTRCGLPCPGHPGPFGEKCKIERCTVLSPPSYTCPSNSPPPPPCKRCGAATTWMRSRYEEERSKIWLYSFSCSAVCGSLNTCVTFIH